MRRQAVAFTLAGALMAAACGGSDGETTDASEDAAATSDAAPTEAPSSEAPSSEAPSSEDAMTDDMTEDGGGDTETLTDPEEVSAFRMAVGDCFDDDGLGDEVSELTLIDCEGPHDNEVYAIYDLPDGDYPGEEEVNELGEAGCVERFEDFVGEPYESSEWYSSQLTPTEGSWDNRNDREVICIVFRLDGPTEGSAAGAAAGA